MVFNAQQWLVDRHVAEGRGQNVAVIAPSATLTCAELADLCGQIAAGLRSLHLHRDDRIVLVTNDEVPMISGILGPSEPVSLQYPSPPCSPVASWARSWPTPPRTS